MIKSFKFGEMVISDTTRDLVFNDDVFVIGTRVEKWIRDSSHNVILKDVEKAVEEKPEVIVIGTGETGLMSVSEEVKDFIASKSIQLIVHRTNDAVDEFNRLLGMGKKVVGLFHLTC